MPKKKKGSAGAPKPQPSSSTDPGKKQETPERSTGPAASEKPANTEPLSTSHSLMDESDGRRENVEDKEMGTSSGHSGGGGGISAAGNEQSAPRIQPTDSSHSSIADDDWETVTRGKKKDRSSGPSRGVGQISIAGNEQSALPTGSGAGSITVSNSRGGSGFERPVKLYCNHFKVDFKPKNQIIYQYNVQFKRKPTTLNSSDQPVAESSSARNNTDEVGKHLKRRILEGIWNKEAFDGKTFAYDGGSILYSIGGQIPQKDYEDHVTSEPTTSSSGSSFDVTIDGEKELYPGSFPTGMTIDGVLQDEPILMPLSILLHNCSAKADRIRVRQNYFSAEGEKGNNRFPRILKFWKGFQSSFRLSYESADSAKPRLMLNFNDTMKCVLNPRKALPVSKHIIEFVKGQMQPADQYLSDLDFFRNERQKINAVLRGVRVEHNGRTYTIRELHSLDSTQTKFRSGPEKEEESVQSYFARTYGEQLTYDPRLPLLHMHSRKDVYIPLEVCKIVAQRYTRLTTQQRTEFLHLSRSDPTDRRSRIEGVSPEIKRPSRKNS